MTPSQITMDRITNLNLDIAGEIGRRLQAVTQQWILPAPLSNPAVLEMFRDRDREQLRDMVPWAGEFAGKYLTHSVQIYRLTRDKKLRNHLKWFVAELISLQADDGYLGCWPKDSRLTGNAPNAHTGNTWDAWGHYHAMLGLLLWHETTSDKKALKCVERIADLFCKKFLNTSQRLVATGSEEMNLAPIHSLCILYQKTGKKKYLQMAQEIEQDFQTPPAGDYIRQALQGKEFYQTPKPRWESLHPIMGIAELYAITGDEKYKQAFEQIWWSIVKLDRHNNGGFTSGEQATGDPYHQGAIETCCTIAWMAMSVEMLRMTGNSIVADELELSTLNAGLAMMNPSGRWVTYDTPMEGQLCASAHSIVFQARPGQPELNCCSVNGPRALGMLSDWAFMQQDPDTLVVNYFGPSRLSAEIQKTPVKIEQQTSYPQAGKITLKCNLKRAAKFTLKLRIPYWSQKTKCQINGQNVGNVTPGQYLSIEKKWKTGDTIKLNLDMRPHYWLGQNQCQGLTSIYRGPVLLAYDPRFNDIEPSKLPTLDAKSLKLKKAKSQSWLQPLMLWETTTAKGKTLRLCDFSSVGTAGNKYKTWLKLDNTPQAEFSPSNPLRSARP